MKTRPIKAQQESAIELDTLEKINKKFDYLCKHYSQILQTDTEFLDDDFNSPNNIKKGDIYRDKGTPYLFRNAIRQKAIIPSRDPILYNKSTNKEEFVRKPTNLEKNLEKLKEIVENSTKSTKTSDNHLENLKTSFHQVYEDIYKGDCVKESRKNISEFFGNAMIAAFLEALINVAIDRSKKLMQENKKEEKDHKGFAISTGSLYS